jgi:hypothetical protein
MMVLLLLLLLLLLLGPGLCNNHKPQDRGKTQNPPSSWSPSRGL